MAMFPRTEVEGISLPRMLIGTNWILGYSHRSTASDNLIKRRNGNAENIAAIADAYMEYGIDAMMSIGFPEGEPLREGLRMVEEKYGHEITKISTPIINVNDSAEGRKEAEATFARMEKEGSKICLIHHSSCEQLINKNKQTMDRLPDYLDMIRQHNMVPGLSAHMPEVIQYSDKNEYDVQTYIQIYNCMGFLMQIEVEGVNDIIWHAKKPVMTIKSMAAGRTTPFVGLNFSYNTLRPCDMVTLGAFTPEEVHEDVEIAMAALERRRPDVGRRSSPNVTSILAGYKK